MLQNPKTKEANWGKGGKKEEKYRRLSERVSLGGVEKLGLVTGWTMWVPSKEQKKDKKPQ